MANANGCAERGQCAEREQCRRECGTSSHQFADTCKNARSQRDRRAFTIQQKGSIVTVFAAGGDVFMPLTVFAFTHQGARLIVEAFDNQLRLIVAFEENLQVFTDALEGHVFWRNTVFPFGKDVFAIGDRFDFGGFTLGQNFRLDNRILIDNGRINWNCTHHNYLSTSLFCTSAGPAT
ncbi:hypothetical protein [Pseudomonas chlororaphis]|uniref:hypothetical protein n=1 Tax=Pseudomonas chlororaphis TaxID=587753 RepID=UPI0013DD9255